MSYQELKQNISGNWPSIDKARQNSKDELSKLRSIIQAGTNNLPFDSEDINIVVFGSLARDEWTSGSDLDWTFLIDGVADHEHANTANTFKKALEGQYKKAGPTGTFGNLTFSHNIIHQIGGQDDSNKNTTQRLLLLLESSVVSDKNNMAYDRVITGILRRYLHNDFRDFSVKVPRFLLNDLHRFWRTMCVDYASKYRERAGKGSCLRNIKLRMSRKLIFASGLVMCYRCHPNLVSSINNEDEMVTHLRTFVNSTPLDILCKEMLTWDNTNASKDILTAYDTFLYFLDSPERNTFDNLSFEELPAKEAEKSTFERLQNNARSFHQGLTSFFSTHPEISTIHTDYGVF